MAKNPEVSPWLKGKAEEFGIKSWKSQQELSHEVTKRIREQKAKNGEKKSGFAAMDNKAETKTETKAPDGSASTGVVLPATQTVDVTAPTINVHVPAPGVTITADQFKFYPFARDVFSWCQAAVIGASIYAFLTSRLTELAMLGVMSP